MKSTTIARLDWEKGQGLLPVIVQDFRTGTVLMTGFANREAMELMVRRRQVVLYSRTRKRIWIKGESSGNYIAVKKIVPDCDKDAILVLGDPTGPSCHTGAESCFSKGEPASAHLTFLEQLQDVITERIQSAKTDSYTAKLVGCGIQRVAQKVGEEALEVALAANAPVDELLNEAADLLFHLLVLLRVRGIDVGTVIDTLEARHNAVSSKQSESAVPRPQPDLFPFIYSKS